VKSLESREVALFLGESSGKGLFFTQVR
jgi:hypothetical protein